MKNYENIAYFCHQSVPNQSQTILFRSDELKGNIRILQECQGWIGKSVPDTDSFA